MRYLKTFVHMLLGKDMYKSFMLEQSSLSTLLNIVQDNVKVKEIISPTGNSQTEKVVFSEGSLTPTFCEYWNECTFKDFR